jgi:hypothetical protein
MENDLIKNMRDNLRSTAPGELAEATFTREVDGAKLSAQIAPCVWMNNGYPLQVEVSMAEGGGRVSVTDKTKTYQSATSERIEQMLAAVKVCKCRNKACKNLAFDPSTGRTNREGECEKCFMAKLKAQFAKFQAKADAKLKAMDARHKAKGFTHRISAWVHPSAGGDDYQIDTYTKGRMKDEDVQRLLKKQGSAVTNDFQIIEL